jgi:hypothetical protein
VYAAETVAFGGTDFDVAIPVGDAIALGRSVVTTSWWPGPPVEIVAARSGAWSSSARCRSVDGVRRHQIRIAAPQSSSATVAHELAHVLAGPDAAHGASFRRAYLDTVAVVSNLDSMSRRRTVHVDQLAAAFAAAGLDVADRRWPAPPPELAGRPIPLAPGPSGRACSGSSEHTGGVAAEAAT